MNYIYRIWISNSQINDIRQLHALPYYNAWFLSRKFHFFIWVYTHDTHAVRNARKDHLPSIFTAFNLIKLSVFSECGWEVCWGKCDVQCQQVWCRSLLRYHQVIVINITNQIYSSLVN